MGGKWVTMVESNKGAVRKDILAFLNDWTTCDEVMTQFKIARGTAQMYLQRGISQKIIEVKHVESTKRKDHRGRPHSLFRRLEVVA
jgi:predicted ArsR family transcriptional regulator